MIHFLKPKTPNYSHEAITTAVNLITSFGSPDSPAGKILNELKQASDQYRALIAQVDAKLKAADDLVRREAALATLETAVAAREKRIEDAMRRIRDVEAKLDE